VRLQRVPLIVLGLAAGALAAAAVLFQTSPGAVARRQQEAALQAAPAVGTAPASPADEGRATIDVLAAVRAQGEITAELSAVLAPIRSVVLAAEVSGRVVEVAAEEHEPVEAGDVLVRLERSLLRAGVERSEAQLLRAEAAHGLARTELARQRDLARRDVASTAELDRAQNQERATYAELLDARAALDDARTRLSKTVVAAPFGGFVNSLDLEPGAYVRAGEEIVELLDIDEIEVEFGVTDREVVALRRGDPIRLWVDVFAGEWFDGTIAQIGRAADRQTQKYPVEARVPNPEARLLPGMLGKVRFGVGDRAPAIRIPRRALQSEFELDYVFVVQGSGDKASVVRRRIAARLVPFRPDLVEVLEGLSEGERIAVSGVRELHDGRAVRVREPRS
jgi:membrane fusion protein (multidrug efflux system)